MERACNSYQRMLSAYADGEAGVRERAQVELHLSACADCRARLEDLRALSSALPAHLEAQVEQADFSGFADAVLRRIEPERPGLLERLRVGWSEILAYHRTAVVSSLATAVVTLAIAVPVVYRLSSGARGGLSPQVIVQELKLEDPTVQPVVMNLGDGKTLIMLVKPGSAGGEAAPLELETKPPSGGDL